MSRHEEKVRAIMRDVVGDSVADWPTEEQAEEIIRRTREQGIPDDLTFEVANICPYCWNSGWIIGDRWNGWPMDEGNQVPCSCGR